MNSGSLGKNRISGNKRLSLGLPETQMVRFCLPFNLIVSVCFGSILLKKSVIPNCLIIDR
jgi:hypothetical protein